MFNPTYAVSRALLLYLKRIAVLAHDLNRRATSDLVRTELLDEASVASTYASTTIEGNPLPLTAVKLLLKRTPASVRQSEREVLNYNRTLRGLGDVPFSEALVLDIHRGVTSGLLVKEKSGHSRHEPVCVHDPRSREIIYWPPDHGDVPRLMAELHAFLEINSDLDPVIAAGVFHKRFVLIHPFLDGNGRTVRLASTVLLRNLGIDLFNLLSFEQYYNRNVSRYVQTVGERGNYYDLDVDFTPWLEYFAEGILDELQRLDKTLEQRQAGSLRLKPHHHTLLAYLDEHGSITDKEYARLVDRAKATRALDFRFLMEHGLIDRQGRGPGTYYVRATSA